MDERAGRSAARAHLNARSRLDSIAAEVSACELCPLAASREKAVPGEGPSTARVMMVGEAPGSVEDRTGRPFMGRAGMLLTETLLSLGSSRDEVFITNVVKCRPPRNRQPKRLEKETCSQAHLEREIQALGPKVVVLLGRTAASTLLQADSLKEVRGKQISRKGVAYLATYHPAAVLRNPRLIRTFRRDLRAALRWGERQKAGQSTHPHG